MNKPNKNYTIMYKDVKNLRIRKIKKYGHVTTKQRKKWPRSGDQTKLKRRHYTSLLFLFLLEFVLISSHKTMTGGSYNDTETVWHDGMQLLLETPKIITHPLTWPNTMKFATNYNSRVLFENRPALYFCNYIFITAYIIYRHFFDSVSKILFKIFMYWSQRLYSIMILIMKTLLHNVYKPNLRLVPNLFLLLC